MARTRRRPSDELDALPEALVQQILAFMGIADLKRLICTCKASRYRRNFTYIADLHLVRRMVHTDVMHKFFFLDGSMGSLLSRVKKTRFAARRVAHLGDTPCCHHVFYDNQGPFVRLPRESYATHRAGRCCQAHVPYLPPKPPTHVLPPASPPTSSVVP